MFQDYWIGVILKFLCLRSIVEARLGILYHNSHPIFVLQDDVAKKQKLKEDQKKLQEAKVKASGKGPMGKLIISV